MKKKVIYITEYLNPPFDEGIKKTAYYIYKFLNQNYNLQTLCREGPIGIDNIYQISTNKMFINNKIKNMFKQFRPDAIIYFPFASSTFAGFIRNYTFANYYKKSINIMIALQPKPLKNWQQFLIKFFAPDIILTPSPALKDLFGNLSINNVLMPLYASLNDFESVKIDQKKILRKKYKIPLDKFIILHVGHLNEGRNLETLIPLQRNNVQVIVVSSSSTPMDATGPASLKTELESAGIIVIDKYISEIQELYQLADLYVFPVLNPNSSIGMPISIVEARACGIPVLTTDYGSIKNFLGDDHGGLYYSLPMGFVEIVKHIETKKNDSVFTSVHELKEKFTKVICEAIESCKLDMNK